MLDAARLLEQAGRIEDGVDRLQTCATGNGDPRLLTMAMLALKDSGRIDDAMHFSQHAAEAGDRDALSLATMMLERVGRTNEATQLR